MDEAARVDAVTVAGLALLLMPLTTMIHEIGGHAAMCVAVGGRVTALGAFYVDCTAPTRVADRLVALAGPGIDAVLALVLWPLLGRQRSDLAQLVCWYLFLCFGFTFSGYLLFSGIGGLGDLNPGPDAGGLAPLPSPWLWRVALAAAGASLYFGVFVRVGQRALDALIGQGPATVRTRRIAAHGFYATACVAAVIASLPNPVGLLITLTSAVASTFGGLAGFISIGYASGQVDRPRAFAIPRRWGVLIAGVIATGLFALILGPTIRPA